MAFNRWVVLVMLGAAACDGRGSVASWEVRHWAPNLVGEFSNGDFVANGERVSASRALMLDEDLPGLSCAHLTPAWDDTDFLACGRVYARAKGASAWVVVPEPPTDQPVTFVGQDRDGARYFLESGAERRLWALPPGASDFLAPQTLGPLEFATLHPFGLLLVGTSWAGSPSAIETEALETAPLRVFRNGAFSASVEARFIDFDGNFFVLTAAGWDRVSPDGTVRDVTYFKRSATNLHFDTLGVGTDGRLFGLSIAKTNLTGADPRRDNEVPIDALMAMAPGDTDWVQVSEPLTTPESRAIGFDLAKPYAALPGRDGSWWLSKCVANCAPNGANTAHQSQVWQWRRGGTEKTSTLRTKWTVWRDGAVHVTLPARGSFPWALPASAAGLGLTLSGSSLPGFSLIEASHDAKPGTHTLVMKHRDGAEQAIELEVKAAERLERQPPRRLVVLALGSLTLWLDTAGAVHQRTAAGVSSLVTALPGEVQSLEGTFAHLVDGRLFRLELSGDTVLATQVQLPALHSMHGCAGLGVDGRVYLLVDGASPIEGLSDVVSLSCHVNPAGNRLTTIVRTLDATGHENEVENAPAFIAPLVTPQPGTRPIRRVGPLRAALGTDGRLTLDATQFGAPLRTLDFAFRGAGSVGGESYLGDFGLAVTSGGEAVVAFAYGGGNTNIGFRVQPLSLPPGRDAVAMTASPTGQWVWLDDGSVFAFPAPDPQSPSSSPSGTRLDLPGVAIPSP